MPPAISIFGTTDYARISKLQDLANDVGYIGHYYRTKVKNGKFDDVFAFYDKILNDFLAKPLSKEELKEKERNTTFGVLHSILECDPNMLPQGTLY